MKKRTATIKRKTKETDITVKLTLDGTGLHRRISTGIGFFDHMLDAFARHGFFDLEVSCRGDLQVDGHHTVEDTGIVLGEAIAKALGDKDGIRRYGSAILPMDETLALSAVDLCGRPYFVMDAHFNVEKVGELDTSLVREFFYAVSYGAMMNLHLRILTGGPAGMPFPYPFPPAPQEKTKGKRAPSFASQGNAHHEIEALFKAFGRALDEAVNIDPRIKGALSTKGTL